MIHSVIAPKLVMAASGGPTPTPTPTPTKCLKQKCDLAGNGSECDPGCFCLPYSIQLGEVIGMCI
jgi:hypothetical protein